MDDTRGWGKKEKKKAFRAFIKLTEEEQRLLLIAINNYSSYLTKSENIPMPPSEFIEKNIWLIWLTPHEMSQ